MSEDPNTPFYIKKNTEIDGKLWLAGVGSRKATVMFVAPGILEEEAATEVDAGYGRKLTRIPRMSDCSFGVLLKKLAQKEGIDMDKCYYTSIVKYLPDELKLRKKPNKEMLAKGMAFLDKEIEAVQPSIIVCLGKLAFDCFVDFRAKEADVFGAWFYDKQRHAKLYMLPHITLTAKPDKHERFAVDLRAIRKMMDEIEGITVDVIPTNYHVIHNSKELEELVKLLETENATTLSVDSNIGSFIE